MEPRVTFHATDEHPLAGRLFLPPAPTPPRAAVILHGATAVPQGFYARFARHLAARHGFAVLTYDYRGVGESRPASLRGLQATMQDWGERDFSGAMCWIRERFPGLPLLGVCHSFGGHALGMSDEAHHLDGALLFGTQLAWVGHWPLAQRLRLEALWRLAVPVLTALYGYLPGWSGVGEDLPVGVARQWARWCLERRYFLDEQPAYAERLAALRFPLRLYGATDDTYARPAGVRAFAAALSPHAEVHILDPVDLGGRPIGHFAPFRPALAQPLWDEAAALLSAWASDSTRPLPAAAG